MTWSAHDLWALGVRVLEHAATVFVGFVLIIVGLALGVTMIMLPVGVPLGLIGVLLVIAGLFVRLDAERP
jgi:NADH:ubiquinone oxidoreductase subunit 6 (subunit J)